MDRPDLQATGIQDNAGTIPGCQGGVLDLTVLYSTVRLIISVGHINMFMRV